LAAADRHRGSRSATELNTEGEDLIMMQALQNIWLGASLRIRSLGSDIANDERGVTTVEYAVMLVLVAIAVIVAAPNITSAVVAVFSKIATELTSKTPAS
jgi:Flp pilus assembly pilin Flp